MSYDAAVMAQWVMDRMDDAWLGHRRHRERTRGCPWCVIMFPLPPRDCRSDEEVLAANAGSLT